MRATRARWLLNEWRDVLLASALAVLGECELYFRALNADFHGPYAVNVVLVVLIAVPVVWRRRSPAAALVVFWVPVQVWLDVLYDAHSSLPLEPFLALLVLVYSAASYAAPRGQRVVALVLAALYASEFALLAVGLKGWGNVVPGLIFISAAYLLGRGVRFRRLRAASLERRAVEAEIDRDVVAEVAVTEERDRIARELHDVIAHSVSVMVIQAGAAERLLDRDPERTRQALESIRTAGGDALDELRRLLGLLRDNPSAVDSTEPQPGLGRLDRLIEQARESGLTVNCAVDGDERALPAGIDLAAYRIVQEALTNIRKHAAGASADVRIVVAPGVLEVQITNDGDAALTANGTGHGLIGMRERVALYGGTLTQGPRLAGGFQVKASIPLEGGTR